MPNYCNNMVIISGDNDKLESIFQKFKSGSVFESIIPVPEELKSPEAHSWGGDDALHKNLLRQENIKKHGYENALDFCIVNWGTKWEPDVYDIQFIDKNQLKICFDTAWNPPLGIYEALETCGFKIYAIYFESGNAFYGSYIDGKNNLHRFGDPKKSELLDELNEHFNVYETMLKD